MLRQQDRDVEHRRGEDDRDHPGLVDLERDIRRVAAHLLSPDDASGEGDRDAPLAVVHEDNEDQQRDRDEEQDHELDRATLVEDRVAAGGEAGDDVGEDEQTHALADAALGDELGEPHDEGRAGGHDRDHEQPEPEVELGDQVDVEAEQRLVVAVEGVDQTGRLQERQPDGEVPGRLGDLLLADGALVAPLRRAWG